MPTLDIVDGDGRLHRWARLVVQATMTYPNDKERREAMILSGRLHPLLPFEGVPEADQRLTNLTPDEIRTLVRSPDPATIVNDAGHAFADAWMVGEMLAFMLCAAQHIPERHFGPTHALYVVNRWNAQAPESRVGGERKLWNAWSRSKPAAHLIMAWTLGYAAQGLQGHPKPHRVLSTLTETQFPLFLSAAESLRVGAERLEILDSRKTWKAPQTLRLPKVRIQTRRLPDAALAILAAYPS
jgi:hypothetical protein